MRNTMMPSLLTIPSLVRHMNNHPLRCYIHNLTCMTEALSVSTPINLINYSSMCGASRPSECKSDSYPHPFPIPSPAPSSPTILVPLASPTASILYCANPTTVFTYFVSWIKTLWSGLRPLCVYICTLQHARFRNNRMRTH